MGLYPKPADVELAYAFNAAAREAAILAGLQQSHEIFAIFSHGTDTYDGLWGARLSKSDIFAHPPGALFCDLLTCLNGDLTNSEYIAGWYLFTGNTLLVQANSAPTFYSEGQLDIFAWLKPLAVGADFGTAYKGQQGTSGSFLFGDPSLRLRQKILTGAPRIEHGEINIDLGTVSWAAAMANPFSAVATAILTNIGSAPLEIMGNWEAASCEPTSFYLRPLASPGFDIGDQVIVPPGGTTSFDVYAANSVPPPPAPLGSVAKRFSYFTNDPLHPFFIVNVTGTVVP
jgi:hypothetical protein